MTAYRYAVTIEGIPTAFAEAGFPTSELSAWAGVLETLHNLNESETTLDLGSRRMLGASFNFQMRDDAAKTLRALVAPRQDPIGWLVESSIPATGTTVATVEVSGTPSDVPQPFYLGFETLNYGGTSGADLTSVTRALYDSTAQKHYGSANDGSATEIFAAPRRWTGRKVTVWESIQDAAGNWGTKTSIAVVRMADAPAFEGADVWAFSTSNLAEWIADRPMVQGLEPVYPKDTKVTSDLSTTVTLDADSVTKLWNGTAFDAARVIWHMTSGSQWILPIESSTSTTLTLDFDKLEVPMDSALRFVQGTGGGQVPVDNTYTWTEAHPVLYWEGDPVDITLAMLVSKLGDSTLGTWDVLPGLEPEEFGGITFQAGAGIPQADIDTDAFKALRGGPGWRIVLTDRMTVKELLAEFCQTTGSYWYVNSAGLLTVQRLTERLPPSTAAASITDALWGTSSADSLGATESTVFHTVRWSGNWDPASEKHRVKLTVVDAKAKHEAPDDAKALEVKARFVSLDVGDGFGLVDSSGYRAANPVSRQDLETSLRRIQQYSKRPAAEIVVEVPVTTTTTAIVPGIVVDVTNARIPDLAGNTLDTDLALCLGAQRNYDEGTFSLRLRLLDNGYLFAPALLITNVVGSTVTVSTSTAYGTANPTQQLAVGWSIEDTQSTWSATVATIASGAVFTVSGVTGTLSIGDVLVPKMDGTLSTAQNSDGYSMNDFCAMVSDDGETPANALTRWS